MYIQCNARLSMSLAALDGLLTFAANVEEQAVVGVMSASLSSAAWSEVAVWGDESTAS